MLVREGNIVFDPEWDQNNWPTLFENSWIQVDPDVDQNNFSFARLIVSNDFDNKVIKIVENTYPEEYVAATFMWCTHLDTYEVTGLSVKGEYQSSGLGYFMANCMRNWLLYTYKKLVLAPPPQSRSPLVEKIIKNGAIEFQDSSSVFLEERDGLYYTYDEWVKIYG